MPLSPDDYAWLSASELGVSGCVTVVPDCETTALDRTFGFTSAADAGESALVGAQGSTTVVFEDNGFQGTREEVLRQASKQSGTGKAASIFWNVNGTVIFSCARRGKMVCSVELIGVEDELEVLPKSLHRLAALCEAEGVDLVAVGAAMVERFTGTRFGPESLATAVVRPLVPVPEDLQPHAVHSFQYDAPDLLSSVAAMDAAAQRRLAEWAATAAIAEAGVDTEPAVRLLAAQWGTGEVPVPPPATAALWAQWERAPDAWEKAQDYHAEEWHGALEQTFLFQKVWAGRAMRYTTHPDPHAAALECVYAASRVFECTRTERPVAFVEDETGRHSVTPPREPGRASAFLGVVRRVTTSLEWDGAHSDLPRPLTAAERRAVIDEDKRRQDRGDFDTWQVFTVQGEDSGEIHLVVEE